MTTSISCGACGAALVAADRFCAGCGAKVPGAEEAVLPGAFVPQDAPPPAFGSSFGKGAAARMRGEHVKRARSWLLAVAVLTAVAGVILYSVLPAELESQRRAILVTNLVLGGFYLGMWVWAKKNLLGATATALTVFVAVVVINAALDPMTLTQGIIMKVMFVVGLGSSVREALAERAERAAA